MSQIYSTVETKKSTQAKRVSVSYESQQENLIMSILAYYGIKFEVIPPRKSSMNCQFIDIKSIIINGQKYDFTNYIEHVIQEHGKDIKPTSTHYNKYQKRNQTAATNNVLTKMLKKLEWKISFKNSKDSTITLKMKRINVLSFGEVVINGEDIAQFGEQLNRGLKSVVSHKRDASLMIGKEELPIEKYVNMKSIKVDVDMSNIQLMLTPINVSKQIGGEGVCFDSYLKKNDLKDVVIDSHVMDGHHQSQIVSQDMTGLNGCWNVVGSFRVDEAVDAATCASTADKLNKMNKMNKINKINSITKINKIDNDYEDDKDCKDIIQDGIQTTTTCPTTYGIQTQYYTGNDMSFTYYRSEERREQEEEEREMKEMNEERKDNELYHHTTTLGALHEEQEEDSELPPSTNVPQSLVSPLPLPQLQQQQISGNSLFNFTGFDFITFNGIEYKWILITIEGQSYWCLMPLNQQAIQLNTDNLRVENVNHTVVEDVNDCGFIQTTNHFTTV